MIEMSLGIHFKSFFEYAKILELISLRVYKVSQTRFRGIIFGVPQKVIKN